MGAFHPRHSAVAVPLPPAWLNAGIVASHAYLAVGYLGPDRLRSSGSYHFVREWAPAWVWAAALAGGAVLCLVSPWLRRWAATATRAAAALPLAVLVAAFLAAQIAATSEGWGALLYLWPLAGHALLIAARHHPETRRA